MEFMNCLLPFVEIAIWVIVIVAICNYDPKKEECVLMKDERGEDVTIYTVKMPLPEPYGGEQNEAN